MNCYAVGLKCRKSSWRIYQELKDGDQLPFKTVRSGYSMPVARAANYRDVGNLFLGSVPWPSRLKAQRKPSIDVHAAEGSQPQKLAFASRDV